MNIILYISKARVWLEPEIIAMRAIKNPKVIGSIRNVETVE